MRQFFVTDNHTLHLSQSVRRRRTSALWDRGPDTGPTTPSEHAEGAGPAHQPQRSGG